MLNKWKVSKNEYAAWLVMFSATKQFTVDAISTFIDQMLNIAHQEKVYSLLNLPPDYDSHSTISYGQHIKNRAIETNRFWGFIDTYEISQNPEKEVMQTPGTVAYYEADQIVELEVNDLGNVIHRLRIDDEAKQLGDFYYHYPPLVIKGDNSLTQKSAFSDLIVSKDIELAITTHTDIWFPWVEGITMECWDYDEDEPGMCSNYELASRHTPRLNNFLKAVRDLTLSLGGTWDMQRSGYPAYNPMLTEWGINLDYDYEQVR